MTRTTVLTAAMLVAAAPYVAQAQDGLRSASLPERPVATEPPPANNPYTATAETYTRVRPIRPSVGWPIIGYDGWYDDAWARPRELQPRRSAEPAVPVPQPMAAPPVVAAVPPPPVVKARPKTFYVIPGCYAGDTRPQAVMVPACDLSQLRIIPPR